MGKRKNNLAFNDQGYIDALFTLQKSYNFYINRLTELCGTCFKWSNVPDSVDIRFVELTLAREGLAVAFIEDAINEFLILQCAIGGTLDFYENPTVRRAISSKSGYKSPSLSEDNSVIVYNNWLRRPTMPALKKYAYKLAELETVYNINLEAQKTPILIVCDENRLLTMKNLYQKYSGGEPVIYGAKNLDLNGISVLKTDAPYLLDKLYIEKTNTWHEALTFLGIPNINVQKKERLITDEVSRLQGGVLYSRMGRLTARQQAAEKINKMFDLNISVEYNNFDDLSGDGMQIGGDGSE